MTNVNHIIADTSKRQYPLPKKKWKYYQEWYDTVFLHWKVPKKLLEEFIPEGLELDTLDNIAWVSLAAFEVKNMSFRNLPSLPYVSDFHEINIRTYVVKDAIPGIYLFSIETNKWIEVLLTRVFIGLSYQKASIKRSQNRLWSENKSLGYHLDISFGGSGSSIDKTDTDLWLTERHSLYEKNNENIYRFDIHHKEWELKNLGTKITSIKYYAGKYALNIYPDKVQYSKKTEVVLWGREKV